MTYRAFVESTHKSPVKRRRMHSSSDAITQEVTLSRPNWMITWSIFDVHLCKSPAVYGSADSVHGSGHPDDPTCEIHQRRSEEAGGRGGDVILHSSIVITGLSCELTLSSFPPWLSRRRWRRRSRPGWGRFQSSWAGSKVSRGGLGVPAPSPRLVLSR